MSRQNAATWKLSRGGLVVLGIALAACSGEGIDSASIADAPNLAPMTAEAAFGFTGTLAELTEHLLVVGDQSVAVVPETLLDPTLTTGQTVKVEVVIQPDGSLVAIEVEPAEENAQLDEFELTGSVQSLAGADWVIGGIAFTVSNDAAVDADIQAGSLVHVEGLIGPDGQFIVKEISLVDDVGQPEVGTEDEWESEDLDDEEGAGEGDEAVAGCGLEEEEQEDSLGQGAGEETEDEDEQDREAQDGEDGGDGDAQAEDDDEAEAEVEDDGDCQDKDHELGQREEDEDLNEEELD